MCEGCVTGVCVGGVSSRGFFSCGGKSSAETEAANEE